MRNLLLASAATFAAADMPVSAPVAADAPATVTTAAADAALAALAKLTAVPALPGSEKRDPSAIAPDSFAAAVAAKPTKRAAVKPVAAATKPARKLAGKAAALNVLPGGNVPAGKPMVKPVVATKPTGKADKPAIAKPSGNVTRTAATVAAGVTSFGNLSDRDNAYLTFYARFAKRSGGKPITLAEIAESGNRPAYNGSNKPHDAGVIVRLTKAGLIRTASDGASFTFTSLATASKAYASAVAYAAAKPAKA